MRGNFHAQFLEGWTGAIPSGYSINLKLSNFGPMANWELAPVTAFLAS